MTLVEGDLQITFNNPLNARRFDDPRAHGLSHCMKAVDFVVEMQRHYQFIELKDLRNPQTSVPSLQRFMGEFKSGVLDESLKYKFRDTFLYEWASGKATKPIDYFVIITGIPKPLLLQRHTKLRRKLPRLGPNGQRWRRALVRRVGVFNIQTWNLSFPNTPIIRLSSQSSV